MQGIKKTIGFLFILSCLLIGITGCNLTDSDDKTETHHGLSRYGLTMVDDEHVFYGEDEYDESCSGPNYDLTCSYSNLKTTFFSISKTSKAKKILYQSPAPHFYTGGSRGYYFVAPFVFVKQASVDSILRINSLTGDSLEMPDIFGRAGRGEGGSAPWDGYYFVSAKQKYIGITYVEWINGLSSHDYNLGIYEYPSGRKMDSLSKLSGWIPSYLEEDSSRVWGLKGFTANTVTLFRYSLLTKTLDSTVFAGTFYAFMRISGGQKVILYQRNGKMFSAPSFPLAETSDFQDKMGQVFSNPDADFELNETTGQYRRGSIIGNLHTLQENDLFN